MLKMNEKYCSIIQNLQLVNINEYTIFDRNPQMNSQDIEHKQNSDIDQGQ